MNIRIIINVFPIIDKYFVIPSDKPTVPNAETVSKKQSKKLCVSDNKIRYKNTPIIVADRITIAITFKMSSFFSVLLPTSVLFLELKVLQHTAIKTPKEVVLIPPPVDPGDAPINISGIRKNKVPALKIVRSILLNPHVLTETLWKKEINPFSNKLNSLKALLDSLA